MKYNWWSKQLSGIYYVLIFLFGGITFLFFAYLFFRNAPFMKCFLDMTTIGQIGDFIGGFLGTILTGITLIMLVRSNIEQSEREIQREHRENFKLYVELIRDEAERFEKTFSFQIFDQTFEEFSSVMNVIVDDVQFQEILEAENVSFFSALERSLLNFRQLWIPISFAFQNQKLTEKEKELLRNILRSRNNIDELIGRAIQLYNRITGFELNNIIIANGSTSGRNDIQILLNGLKEIVYLFPGSSEAG
jgi:transcription termination factor NusB